MLAFGLRGNVYRSDDAGKSWTKVEAGLPAAVVGGGTHVAAMRRSLADVGGRVVASEDGGRTFTPLALEQAMPLTGLVEAATAGSRWSVRAASRSPTQRPAERSARPKDTDHELPSPTISNTMPVVRKLARLRPATRATCSSGWCSTTGC